MNHQSLGKEPEAWNHKKIRKEEFQEEGIIQASSDAVLEVQIRIGSTAF